MAMFHICVKTGGIGKAANHSAYIAREGSYGKNRNDSDLIATDYGNLPAWAVGNPKYFWKMADENERINGATYRELEVALPNELTEEQNLQLVRELIKYEVGDKPYQFAVHAPTAALGKVSQPHAHLMISDRVPDGVERSPQQFFKRYNRYDPPMGGRKKSSGGKARDELRNELLTIRETWATLQNAALEKYGHTARVDHRSHVDRQIAREPEQHLGQARIKSMTEHERETFSKHRSTKA